MDQDNCIDSSIIMNGWATFQDLAGVQETDKRTLLIEFLHEHLDSSEHTLADLPGRDTTSPSGGLCGIAFLYKALHDTVLTKSQLKFYSHLSMKKIMIREMHMEESMAKTETDKYVLGIYNDHTCAKLSRSKRKAIFQNQTYEVLIRNKRETIEDEEARFYGTTLVYECGLAREFYDPEKDSTYIQRNITCNWNKTWSPINELDDCVWVACVDPPQPPFASRMVVDWDGIPVNFTDDFSYTCNSNDVPRYFENNRSQEVFSVTCLPSGGWLIPAVWPLCLETVSCSEPPPRPESGTWEWNKKYDFGTEILYTCGPNGKFLADNGTAFDEIVSTCTWNKSFIPAELPDCVATSCPIVPLPPKFTGLEFYFDPSNDFRLDSPFSRYSPPMPAKIPFPGDDFCQNSESTLKIIGKMTSDNRHSYGHIVFMTDNDDEAYHIKISLYYDVIYRSSNINASVVLEGSEYDGTTLDLHEPFLLTVSCDEDGWIFEEDSRHAAYPHFIHKVPVQSITHLEIFGGMDITYVGFVNKQVQPSPPVNFNITFKCPQGRDTQ